MLKLVKYLRGYTKESILAPLFKLLEASFELLVPLVMAGIIDHGIAQENTAYIVRMGAVLVGLAIVGLCSAITAQYFSAKAAEMICFDISLDFLMLKQIYWAGIRSQPV